MANPSQLTGVPWHVEIPTMDENDTRRHKSRCEHYDNGHCKQYATKCSGSAHCVYYLEKASHNIDDEIKPVALLNDKSFNGIKSIPINQIHIPEKIASSHPDVKKLNMVIEYFKKCGELDRPIVVEIKDEKYVLKDKYIRYLAARKLGLKNIFAEMGDENKIATRNKLRTIGTLVWIKKINDAGEVIKATITQTTIKSDNGSICTYDICKCLETGEIRIL